MSTQRIRVSDELACNALGFAYLKGDVNEPLPKLSGPDTRRLVTQTLGRYDADDFHEWPDRLQVYPSTRDPRTLAEVVKQVQEWAEARVRRMISHYRPSDLWRLFDVEVDPAEYRDEW